MKSFLYKLLALLTLSSALALGIITLHFSLAEVSITIIAQHLPMSRTDSLTVEIEPEDTENPDQEAQEEQSEIKELREQVLGNEANTTTTSLHLTSPLREASLALTHVQEATGPGVEVADYATGTVTVYNEMNFPQQLVRRTRLLTTDGVLFRILENVSIAGGSNIEVRVQADEKGVAGNIAPTALSIPGLSGARQKQVYAKNSAPFKGGVFVVKTLSEGDFEQAQQNARALLESLARETFNKDGLFITTNQILLEDIVYSSDDEPGEQKPELTLRATAHARAVMINPDEVLDKAKILFEQSIPPESHLLAYNEESFSYVLTAYDELKERATIETYLEGFTTLSSEGAAINKRDFIGLSAKEVQDKLLQIEAVHEVQVRFHPFWVTRTPRIEDKITVIIEKKATE